MNTFRVTLDENDLLELLRGKVISQAEPWHTAQIEIMMEDIGFTRILELVHQAANEAFSKENQDGTA